jgi:hypothetical protein
MLYFSAMKNKERNIKARQKWLQIYEELGSVTTASIKCGISRSTLYRRIERSKSEEDTKLSDKSKRPKTLSNLKVTDEIETLILDIRRKHNWGVEYTTYFNLKVSNKSCICQVKYLSLKCYTKTNIHPTHARQK